MKIKKSDAPVRCPLKKEDVSFEKNNEFEKEIDVLRTEYRKYFLAPAMEKTKYALEMLKTSEKISEALRNKISESENISDELFFISPERKNESDIVKVFLQSDLFSVTAPVPVKRKKEDSWYVYKVMYKKIAEFAKTNPEYSFSVIKNKFFVIFRRHYVVLQNNVMDNDNIESKRMVNLICSAFGTTDGVTNMKFVSTAVKDSSNFLEIIMMPESELTNHLDLLLD